MERSGYPTLRQIRVGFMGEELEEHITEQQKVEAADILNVYKASREHRIAQFAVIYCEILVEIDKKVCQISRHKII